MSPGLDHPPPLLGDGERDKDIEPYGVPGIGGNGWAWPPVGKPDEAPRRLPDGRCSCRFNCGACLVVDDVRRRRCAPVVTWEEEGEARLMKLRNEEKLASSLNRM